MGLRGFGRLNFDSGWAKGPNHTSGIATFPRAPGETAARPMSYPAIAQWAGGCLTRNSGEGRGLSHRGCQLGPFPHWNRDFGDQRLRGMGLSWDIRLWGDIGYRRTSGSGGHPALVGHLALKAASHGTRRLNKSFYTGLIWLRRNHPIFHIQIPSRQNACCFIDRSCQFMLVLHLSAAVASSHSDGSCCGSGSSRVLAGLCFIVVQHQWKCLLVEMPPLGCWLDCASS